MSQVCTRQVRNVRFNRLDYSIRNSILLCQGLSVLLGGQAPQTPHAGRTKSKKINRFAIFCFLILLFFSGSNEKTWSNEQQGGRGGFFSCPHGPRKNIFGGFLAVHMVLAKTCLEVFSCLHGPRKNMFGSF